MKTDANFTAGVDYENNTKEYFVEFMKEISHEILLLLKDIPYVGDCEIGGSPPWLSPYHSQSFIAKEGPFGELIVVLYPPIGDCDFKWGFCICFDERLQSLGFWDQRDEAKSKDTELILDAVPKMVAALNEIKKAGVTFHEKAYSVRLDSNNFDKELRDVTEQILREGKQWEKNDV